MRPLVPALIAFMTGIALSEWLGLSVKASLAAIVASALPLLAFSIKGRDFSRLAVIPPFFFLGALFVAPHVRPAIEPGHIREIVERGDEAGGSFSALGTAVEGVVASSPEYSDDRVRMEVEARRVLLDGRWQGTSGKILLTLLSREARFMPGERVRFVARLKETANFGNPGEFDYKGYLNLRGIYATAFLKGEGLITVIGGWETSLLDRVEGFRGSIRSFIDSSGAVNRAPLKALIIGEERGIDPVFKEALLKTGTWHIISISGLHIGIVALFSYGVILFLLKRSERLMLAFNVKKVALALTAFPVAAYALLAGLSVPTQRSLVMFMAFTVSYFLNRGRDLFNTLALAAFIVLMITPYVLWDASFQLTFAAMAAIFAVAPGMTTLFNEKAKKGRSDGESRIKRFLLYKVSPAAAVTIAASLGTAPIAAWHFHRLTLTGILANLAVIPLSGVIIHLLIASACVLPFWALPAKGLILLADRLLSLLAWSVGLFSSLPWSSLWVPPPALLEIALFYGLLYALINLKRGRAYLLTVPVLAFALTAERLYASHAPKNGTLKVTFISVGQGDSSLIEFPGGKTMLIDGGGSLSPEFDMGERVIAPFLWAKGIGKIDYMVLSHSQLDHRGGLSFIAENFGPDEFWWNGEGELGGLGKLLREKGVTVKVVNASTGPLDLGGVRVEPLNPGPPDGLDANDRSLVLKLSYGSRSFLFTGDMGEAGEREILKKNIAATVLKAPHHGSHNSSTMPFLEKTRPSVVVVSAGRGNAFGFPRKETLERYAAIKARVFRTDLDGAVEVSTDGDNVRTGTYLTGGMR